jgi:hypothetical protein
MHTDLWRDRGELRGSCDRRRLDVARICHREQFSRLDDFLQRSDECCRRSPDNELPFTSGL